MTGQLAMTISAGYKHVPGSIAVVVQYQQQWLRMTVASDYVRAASMSSLSTAGPSKKQQLYLAVDMVRDNLSMSVQ